MNARRTGTALLLALLLLPAAAFSQDEHQHDADAQSQRPSMMGMQGAGMGEHMMSGDMMMGESMDMAMMGAMMRGPSPATILKQSETLGLGPDQVRKLEALQSQARIGRESRMTRMKELHAQLSETLSGDEVDAAEYEAVLQEMANQRVAMHVQNMTLGQQALKVLSQEQRAKLSSEHAMGSAMMGAGDAPGHPCPMGGGADEGGR